MFVQKSLHPLSERVRVKLTKTNQKSTFEVSKSIYFFQETKINHCFFLGLENDVLQGDIYKKTLNGKSTVLSQKFLKLTSTDKEYHILHRNSQKKQNHDTNFVI